MITKIIGGVWHITRPWIEHCDEDSGNLGTRPVVEPPAIIARMDLDWSRP
jgi:hypothetical protein